MQHERCPPCRGEGLGAQACLPGAWPIIPILRPYVNTDYIPWLRHAPMCGSYSFPATMSPVWYGVLLRARSAAVIFQIRAEAVEEEALAAVERLVSQRLADPKRVDGLTLEICRNERRERVGVPAVVEPVAAEGDFGWISAALRCLPLPTQDELGRRPGTSSGARRWSDAGTPDLTVYGFDASAATALL